MPGPRKLLRLHPAPRAEVDAQGLYLARELHQRGREGAPFVYADFVSSLDGRIALADAVPPELTGGTDLRLLLELQAQADCVITNAGYLRAIAEGRQGDILRIGSVDGTIDLAHWRRRQGLADQPVVVIASASLDFEMPASLAESERTVLIATTRSAPAGRIERWRARGHRVLVAGEGDLVAGRPLVEALGRMGLGSLFLLAGPRMLETMLREGVLARLYLTLVHRLLGGEAIATMIAGPPLGPAGRLRLAALYHDADGPNGVGQWFAEFEAER